MTEMDWMKTWIWGFIAVVILLFFLAKKLKNMNKDMINDLIDNKLNQLPPYPKINISYKFPEKPIHFEFPYLITGTCNEIDYISHRSRGHPTPFEIDRFRHHCIYEYEKSGKSKVSDYKEYE